MFKINTYTVNANLFNMNTVKEIKKIKKFYELARARTEYL